MCEGTECGQKAQSACETHFPSGPESKNIKCDCCLEADEYPLEMRVLLNQGKVECGKHKTTIRMRKHADKVLEEVGYHISFQFTKVRHRHNGSNDSMFSLNKSDLGPSIRFFCATFIERGRAPHRKQDTETTRLPCVCMQNPPPPKNEHALKDFLCVANMRQLLHAAN